MSNTKCKSVTLNVTRSATVNVARSVTLNITLSVILNIKLSVILHHLSAIVETLLHGLMKSHGVTTIPMDGTR